jgi:hypothetical protein
MADAASVGSEMVGCAPDELVLRGGQLKEAVLLMGIQDVGVVRFTTLFKNCPKLCQFLTGEAAYKRPLAKSLVFELLASERNKAMLQLVRVLQEASLPLPPVGEDDPTAALRLDSEPVRPSVAADAIVAAEADEIVAARRRGLVGQLPPYVEVVVHHPGAAPWSLRVLVARRNTAASIEATAANFKTLYQCVQHDLQAGTSSRERFRQPEGMSRKEPRGDKGAREYWVRNRWVRKEASSEPPKTKRAHTPRYRTLKRRGTDEQALAALGAPVAPRRRKAQAAAAAAPVLDAAPVADVHEWAV